MTEFEKCVKNLADKCGDLLNETGNKDIIVLGGIIVSLGMAILGSMDAHNERLGRIESLLLEKINDN